MVSKIEKIIPLKYIYSFIFSLIILVSFHFQGIMRSNNLIAVLVFLIILYSFIKTDLFNKEYFKGVIVVSIIFSLIYTNGRILYDIFYNNNISFWIEITRITSIISMIGNFLLIYLILINVIPIVLKIDIFSKSKSKVSFIKNALIMLICWLPYYIIYYPGIATSDSISQLSMINGNVPLTNHHPIISTLVMGIPYKIVSTITGNNTIAMGAATLIQMIILASIFSYTISFLNKRNVSKKIQMIVLLYFALFPINGFYSITLWKDVVFGGLVLLLILEIIKLVENRNNLKLKNTWSFIIVSILCILYRSNAIYMYYIFILVTFIIMHKYWKYFIKAFPIILVSYFIITGPIFNLFKIEKPNSSEYIAIPLQQIGRMAYKNVEFTEEETNLLNELIGVEELKKSYNPEIVDSIKFNANYNINAFNNNKLEYLKLWFNLCRKHPDIATESYFISTLGYYYPDTNYWIIATEVYDNDMGIKQNALFNDKIKNTVSKIVSRSLPVVGIIYSIGFCFWLLILSMYFAIKNKKILALYCIIPILGIWITMMIAAPVFSEFRYVYAEYTTIPILLMLHKIINKEKV